jgi:hypothetical protein
VVSENVFETLQVNKIDRWMNEISPVLSFPLQDLDPRVKFKF